MTNFRRAFMETMQILQMPAETHNGGAPSEFQASRAVVDKLLSATGLDSYTRALMGYYNGELAKIKASIPTQTTSKDYVGELAAGGTSIYVGATLYKPALYLDGVRMDKNSFTFSGSTINLKEAYSKKYKVVWYVEDTGSPARASVLAEEPISLFSSLPQENEQNLESTHIFTNSNLTEEWNLGADISNYKRLSLSLGDGNILDITTQILLKNKFINTKVVFTDNGEDEYYKEQTLVLELINNNSIKIKTIYDDTRRKTNALIRDLECEIVLVK